MTFAMHCLQLNVRLSKLNPLQMIILHFQDALRGVYLTSTVTEWLLAFSILTFTLTYAPDFKNMRVDDPNIYFEPKFEVSFRLIFVSPIDKLCKIKPSLLIEFVDFSISF
jgi:hypothetical protein